MGIPGYWLELQAQKSDNAVIELAEKYAALDHDAKRPPPQSEPSPARSQPN
ncbi:MAG: hypothetical protein ACYTAS_18205 [Planctomycetota bacterium]|jgi:hypothetical protein